MCVQEWRKTINEEKYEMYEFSARNLKPPVGVAGPSDSASENGQEEAEKKQIYGIQLTASSQLSQRRKEVASSVGKLVTGPTDRSLARLLARAS